MKEIRKYTGKYISNQNYIIFSNADISVHWSGPQLPKGCGCIGFLSPMHKKIPDSYLKREGGTPGILVYSYI